MHAARLFVLVLAAMCVAIGAGGCQKNTTTGRSQFLLLSLEQEAQLGAEAKPQMLAEMGGEIARGEIRAYVTQVGNRLLVPALERDPEMRALAWEFTVLDSDVINAFALPGGKVFMSRGLMQKMTNEAQLAAVLGHEIGHVTARHGNERVSRTAAAQMGLEVASSVLSGSESGPLITQLAGQGTQLFLMRYDRRQESESDSLGAEYMVGVKYDPMGAVQVMEILAEAAGGQSPPEILSTHPDPARRAQDLRAKIAAEFSFSQGNPEYTLREAEFRQNVLRRLSTAYPHAGTPRLAAYPREGMPEGATCSFAGCGH
ncbi:MAG: M48 family metallopeptidase [Planctomycetota bacterium]|nr:M48 family metallopeptidase [Planctomycetota bacterium]